MSVRARAVGEGRGVLIEGNQEWIKRHDLECGGRGGEGGSHGED